MSLVRIRRATALATLVLAVASVGQAAATARHASSLATGPLRGWGGTAIRSLDPPSAVADAETPSGRRSVRPPLRDIVLSNETTFTRWAYVAEIAPIYRHPASGARRFAQLHWYTADGFPEIYLLLRAHWDATGREWVRVRVPMRPNGTTGWVRAEDLGNFHLTHSEIIVDRNRLRMYVEDRGRQTWSAPVAVGKPSTPTPPGHFWIRERFNIEDPSSGYWPYAFGTSDYSTLTDWPGGGVVGIHGPYFQPEAIPGRVSHGCIRLRVSDDIWFAHHIGLGTPLEVR